MTHVDDAIMAALPHAEIVPDELGDADLDYLADLGYLRSLSNYTFSEVPGFTPQFPTGPTVEQRLLADMSTAAREAISGEGWTFEEMWANA